MSNHTIQLNAPILVTQEDNDEYFDGQYGTKALGYIRMTRTVRNIVQEKNTLTGEMTRQGKPDLLVSKGVGEYQWDIVGEV